MIDKIINIIRNRDLFRVKNKRSRLIPHLWIHGLISGLLTYLLYVYFMAISFLSGMNPELLLYFLSFLCSGSGMNPYLT